MIGTLSRSKIAICIPRNITNPELYDLSTITSRYFECFSSKCLVLGDAPSELIELFGYDPIIRIDYNNPQKQVSELLLNFNNYISLIEKNYLEVIKNHQWDNRIKEMIRILENYK